MTRLAWIDATAGVAGDMLLGALLDAGADLEVVRGAVAAVAPGAVDVSVGTVRRAGQRAVRAEVTSTAATHAHRAWADVRALLEAAELDPAVRDPALATFTRLAEVEGRVHDVDADHVAFHEVGAWDSIADVVGVCAALADLGVTELTASPVAVGSGRVRGEHGDLPVPVPAVLGLAQGWTVVPGGDGELATPTGMALVRTLARRCGPVPAMTVDAVGVGAGGRDVAGRANVTRVVLGQAADAAGDPAGVVTSRMWLLESNVDDLDPRVWPTVLAALLDAGAADAWLVPIVMKKGRPAHTLSVLAHGADREPLRAAVFGLTATLGVRESPVDRVALGRDRRPVRVTGGEVRVKAGLRGGRVVHVTPEFEDAARVAGERGVGVRQVLAEAAAAAEAAGLRPGASWPSASLADTGPDDTGPDDTGPDDTGPDDQVGAAI